MENAFSNLVFNHNFRIYQKRVLDQLDHHLQDNKVHIVAPPGAGKTILGLEIIRRVAKNCLVLVPTLTIRSQWVERLCCDFVNGHSFSKDNLSHDLNKPAPLTVITYQGLHQALKKDKNLISSLSFFPTIVVDECHHLRREWWRSLQAISKMHEITLIALTATPPYDANGLEWRRYHEFCGPIDEEITSPELVASGDLCPHQDFIWPVLPSLNEQQVLNNFTEQRRELWSFLEHYQALNLHIQEHPWFCKPEDHFESLYERPAYFTAMLSVLKFLGSSPPVAALGILHGEATIPPKLNNRWLSCFLEHSFFNDPYWETKRGKEVLSPVKQRLSRMGAIERKKIHLDIPSSLAKRLRRSSNKLTGISNIAGIEYEKLHNDLRLVILTDYIKPEVLPTTKHDQSILTEIGAAPIFEDLRRSNINLPPMAVLTGSLVIIPKHCQSILKAYAEAKNMEVFFQLAPGLPNYFKVQSNSSSGKQLVPWITKLFIKGHIQIIIGTQALLGEGWDAPAINSLILANTVGSYVLSNQMRGRAIRIDKEQPNKTANIWHLTTIDQATENGGYDLNLLKRRFSTFIGPNHYGSAYLSNDFDRMGRLPIIDSKEELNDIQQEIRLLAQAREGLAQKWNEALKNGDQLITAIQPPILYEHQEDGLSRYYYIQATESVMDLGGKLSKAMYLCLPIAIIVSATIFSEASPQQFFYWSFVVGLPMLTLASLKGILLIKAVYELKKLKDFWMSTYFAIIVSAFIFSIGILFNTLVGLGIFLIWFSFFSLYFLLTQLSTLSSVRFYEKIGQFNQFTFAIGKNILASLANEELVDLNIKNKLKTKKSHSNSHPLYLDGVTRYESELFEKSISEFFAPVDRQRYLLAIRAVGASTEDVHYMPVPSVFKYKAAAQHFCSEIKKTFDQDVNLIYTRTPAGRLHLLNARLQVLDLNENNQIRKEKIWL